MRGFLASSIGVTCAATLALPLTPPAVASTTARPAPTAEAATTAGPAAAGPAGPAAGPAVQRAAAPRSAAEPSVPGATQSLPLQPLTRKRTTGVPAEQGLPRRGVRHFSLVGVVWDDPDTELHGVVQVRTRAAGTGTWSGWQDVETHNADHGADAGTPERTSGRVRGATAPLWVGDSDGVEVRVRAQPGREDRVGTPSAAGPLPAGLRLELVDPGTGPDDSLQPAGFKAAGTDTGYGAGADSDTDELGAEAAVASAANAALAPLGATEVPPLDRAAAERELPPLTAQRAKPYIGPRPSIVTRRGWGADESLREKTFVYTKKVKAAFVHHTASGNNYRCSQAPSLIRSIYRYHVKSMGWRDIGYNFVIDKCGRIYEGRAGGVAKPVLGAHTLGFNSNSMGIAVIGSYGSKKPSSAAVKAIARLTAWKLGLYGMNPKGKTYLKSGGGNLYRKGKKVRLNVISGHRDGFATECPGGKLYGKLGSVREKAARYQGR
ncbi:peptidoglycan recognition protein [Streptomyces sp. NPDC052682]|uniref:peptidoglycan recognition protein family protein n=1 Tax=Streptomyces sp. NPDC052682 TaxID=3154954 RepID=UPI00342E1A9B